MFSWVNFYIQITYGFNSVASYINHVRKGSFGSSQFEICNWWYTDCTHLFNSRVSEAGSTTLIQLISLLRKRASVFLSTMHVCMFIWVSERVNRCSGFGIGFQSCIREGNFSQDTQFVAVGARATHKVAPDAHKHHLSRETDSTMTRMQMSRIKSSVIFSVLF